MNAMTHHRSLGVFPTNQPPPFPLQALRACREFFDKVDIDRLRKLVRNFSQEAWADFTYRNESLAEIIRDYGWKKVLDLKLETERTRIAYYVSCAKRSLYLPTKHMESPAPVSFLTNAERWVLRTTLGATLAWFSLSAFTNPTLSVEHTAGMEAVLPPQAVARTPTRGRYEMVESGPTKTKLVTFGSLAGENVGRWKTADKDNPRNLNALYTGIEGRLPAATKVNYCSQLTLAWQAKLNRDEVSPATVKALPYTISTYCEGAKTYTDLPTYLGDVQERIDASYAAINFDGLCDKFKADTSECELVRTAARGITAEHIVAYGLTELMPRPKDGEFNAAMLDHLFQNAGMEFVMSFPALGDPLGSKGLFQFTWMGHSNSPEEGRQGAAHLNPFVAREYKIPESVIGPMGLKPNDHDRAAYYFAIYNIVSLVAKLNDDQKASLAKVVADGRTDEVAEFVATSHHAQGDVRKFARRWLKHPEKPFRDFLKNRFVTYGMKFRYNLAGTRDFLAKQNKVGEGT
jgi:hypothetical protein